MSIRYLSYTCRWRNEVDGDRTLFAGNVQCKSVWSWTLRQSRKEGYCICVAKSSIEWLSYPYSVSYHRGCFPLFFQFLVQSVRVSNLKFPLQHEGCHWSEKETRWVPLCRYDQKRSFVTFRNPRSFDPENLDVYYVHVCRKTDKAGTGWSPGSGK